MRQKKFLCILALLCAVAQGAWAQNGIYCTASTQIIIAPGYKYHIVRRMITNFHQPQSTLLLLVSAFIGDNWHQVYDYALAHDFRFLSYGDSSLLEC